MNYTIEGVQLATEYEVFIQSGNPTDDGTKSEVVLIKTPDGVPSAPREFRVALATADEINLEWLSPTRPNGVLHGYLFVHCEARVLST